MWRLSIKQYFKYLIIIEATFWWIVFIHSCLTEHFVIYNINQAIHKIKYCKTWKANTNHKRLELRIRTLNFNLESLIVHQSHMRNEFWSILFHARRERKRNFDIISEYRGKVLRVCGCSCVQAELSFWSSLQSKAWMPLHEHKNKTKSSFNPLLMT